jgi:hypothetical protein
MSSRIGRIAIGAMMATTALVALGIFAPLAAQAATITWTGGISTAWTTGTNWNPAGPPITTSGVVINPAAHEPTISTAVFLNGNGASLLVNNLATLTISAVPSGALVMTSGNHPLTLMGSGTILDNGSLFASSVNLNGGSITNVAAGFVNGILVGPSAHFSMGSITGFGTVNLPISIQTVIASGGTMILEGGINPLNSITVTPSGVVDMGQNVDIQSLFGSINIGSVGTLDLEGFNVTIQGVPLLPGLYKNGTNDSFVNVINSAGAVPEPATWAMMLLGFVGLGFAFRQSRRKVSLA